MDADDLREVMRLLALVDSEELTLFELRWGDLEVIVARGHDPLPETLGGRGTAHRAEDPRSDTRTDAEPAPRVTAGAPAGAGHHESRAAAPASRPDQSGDNDPAGTVTVRAPMLGTFYRAPNPDADAYVEVGDHVDADATIALIEAMKVFTAVPAGASGSVKEILTENGAFIEYDQPLMVIVPD